MNFEWKMTLGTLVQLIVLGLGGFFYIGDLKSDVKVLSIQVALLDKQIDKLQNRIDNSPKAYGNDFSITGRNPS